MTNLEFFVSGTPAPQGSKRHVGGGRMVESSTKLKPWREDIVRIARHAAALTEWVPTDAVIVELSFYLLRPKSVTVKKRFHPSVKPDLDKLIRGVFDSLTIARVITDDASVVSVVAEKQYADRNEPGVNVTILPAGGRV